MPGFQEVCSVKANLNELSSALKVKRSAHGVQYWSLSFNVCIHFGRTELRAFLEWVENVRVSASCLAQKCDVNIYL
jgi:hypothetical protein